MVSIRIRPAIVLFGDSITQQGFGLDGKIGWASLLSSDYSRRADVLNRGFSGYNTKMALDLLPTIFTTATDETKNDSKRRKTTTTEEEKTTASSSGASEELEDNKSGILFCTIFFGANDAALPGERQHVPIEDYGKNLGTIIDSIRDRTNTKSCDNNKRFPIILITPPPFDAAAWKAFRNLTVDGRANDVAKSYGEQVQKVGKSHDCSVLNTWELLEGNTTPEVYGKYLSDGLHLNEAGNRKVHEGLMKLIRQDHPNLAPLEENGTGSGIPVEEKLWEELC